jgi:hypothetical protein
MESDLDRIINWDESKSSTLPLRIYFEADVTRLLGIMLIANEWWKHTTNFMYARSFRNLYTASPYEIDDMLLFEPKIRKYWRT